jgi:hypothetical protein
MIYVCAVSPKAQDNYAFGLLANTWGVEEKYHKRIAPVKPGDLLVFISAAHFRSIHRVESAPYLDEARIWPDKDGSRFPHRVSISKPVHAGAVPVDDLAESISFMAGRNWNWAIRGANGVFNPKLTAAELDLIRSRMEAASNTRDEESENRESAHDESSTVVFASWSEARLQSELEKALAAIPLITEQEWSERLGAIQPSSSDVIPGVYAGEHALVIVDFHRGEVTKQALFDLLERMSWIRNQVSGREAVEGLLLAEEPGDELISMITFVPNVTARRWTVGIVLDPDPRTQRRRRAA